MKAQFDPKEVKTLLDAIPANSKITLVGDQGVYLMSFAQKVEKGQSRTVVYAKGCNPEKDGDDWYENKGRLFGGDDGGDDCGTAGEFLEWFKQGDVEKFFVDITPNSFAAGVVFAPDLKAWAEWELGVLTKYRTLDLAVLQAYLARHQVSVKVGSAKEKKTSRHLIPLLKSVIREKDPKSVVAAVKKAAKPAAPKVAIVKKAALTEPCGSCKNGKQTITITTIGSLNGQPPTPPSTSELDCFECKGKGIVPLGFNAKRKAAEEAFWCNCGKSEGSQITFHDDGECRTCQKHHYHCGNCGKITQVG